MVVGPPVRRRDVIPLRTHETIVRELLAVIREQNDRIMMLAGRPWALPDREPWVPSMETDELLSEGLEVMYSAEQMEPEL